LDVSMASGHITISSIRGVISVLASLLCRVWDSISSVPFLNPLAFAQHIVEIQRNAMGRTSEAIVTGIQSVATGVGSAGTAALNRIHVPGGIMLMSSASSRSDLLSVGGTGNTKAVRDSTLNEKVSPLLYDCFFLYGFNPVE